MFLFLSSIKALPQWPMMYIHLEILEKMLVCPELNVYIFNQDSIRTGYFVIYSMGDMLGRSDPCPAPLKEAVCGGPHNAVGH